jgi:hypothetical protein
VIDFVSDVSFVSLGVSVSVRVKDSVSVATSVCVDVMGRDTDRDLVPLRVEEYV